MRKVLCFSFQLLVIMQTSFSQTVNSIDTNFNACFDKLPRIVSSVEEAGQEYFPKNKMNNCRRHQQEIQQQINKLYGASNHQSRLLSMLAGKYDDESEHYDFTKIKLTKDPVLNTAVTNANTAFFSVVDDYTRKVGSRVDSAQKQYTGKELAKRLLDIYQYEFSILVSRVKNQWKEINKLMLTKGYNKLLAAGKTDSPYFIQLLEVRGILYDRLLKLNQQVEIANNRVAEMVKE
jgi:hypothetical protein